jgi:2-iminoacetate synthase
MSSAIHSLSRPAVDFIDDVRLEGLVSGGRGDTGRLRAVIAKSLAKEPLDVGETAVLLAAEAPDAVDEIFEAARRLKREVYGNRIVFFAPLYVGNECVNDCLYCGFRRSNGDTERLTLERAALARQVASLEEMGHKRLILVFGEHPRYGPDFIAESVRTVSNVRAGRGEIRRVNINAAPLDVEGFRTVKASGIGTYQVFQETYHHRTYAEMHPAGTRKSDYLWRLHALGRAMEGGCDDVGIGALFGLYDWRFEMLGLVAHANFLRARYGVGPHTISFPRVQPASGVALPERWKVSDAEFKRLVAVLRLSVPYTGLILTARERPEVRRDVMDFGVSQIDAGSRIDLGGYAEPAAAPRLDREQFVLGDTRPLDCVIGELLAEGHMPSFCTACYRVGRTGEQFMEYAVPGFIQRFCTPNAILTLAEYLADYASPETRAAGERMIDAEMARLPEDGMKPAIRDRLRRIRDAGERDLYF